MSLNYPALLKKGILFLVATFACCGVYAQCNIQGVVTDSIKAPIPYAAVGLLNSKDSSLVKGALCNDSGLYVFENMKPGSYLLKVEVTGYPGRYSNVIKATDGSITVPAVQMKNSGNNLNGVRVVADKPFIEHQAGKTIFNVEGSPVSAGKNALEVLNDLPGVTTDDNANINVHGKGGVLVLVDDKPIFTDLATYLKSIDAGQIEKIEIITNPSAKYEASGKAVINIVLKKDKNLGLNGQFTSNCRQWLYTGFNENLNINYRTKKWNFFANVGVNIFHNLSTRSVHEIITAANGTQTYLDEQSPFVTQGAEGSGTAGIDFTPDSRQTISLSMDGNSFLTPDKMTTTNTTIIHSQSTSVDSTIYNPSVTTFHNTNIRYILSYKFKMDTNGRELSAFAGYLPYTSLSNIQSPLYYYNSAGDVMRNTMSTGSQQGTVNVWQSQADYVQPLNKKSKLEMGLMAHSASTVNIADFTNTVQGVTTADTTKTNQFNLREDMYAGYVNYYRKLNEKFDFQFGVRAEQTDDYGYQVVHDTSFTRHYLNLFPSAGIDWKVDDNNSFTVSYSKRIDRPGYDDLNPFLIVIGPYTYLSGNVNLLPQLTDNYELDYNLGELVNLTLGYIHFSNVMTFASHLDNSTLVTYESLINLGTYNVYYEVLTSTLHPAKWWTMINTLYSYHDNYIGNFYGSNVDNSHLSFQVQSNNVFNFKHGWRAQIMAWYHSANLNGVATDSPLSDLDIGIGKRFKDGKFAVNLSCSDVFAWQVETKTQNTPGFYIVNTQYGDQRKVRASLTWKFGKSQYQREEQAMKNLLKGK